MNRKKVVVIGIDGMSPELFDVLVKKDIFRNLKELQVCYVQPFLP